MFRQAAVLLSVFLVKRCLIPISSDQDIRHPVRCTAHDGCDGFYRYILVAFNDKLVMDMADNEAVGEILHGEAQQVTGYGLDDILNEFWTVRFDAFPFLGRSHTFIGDGFPAEAVLSNLGLHVGELPAGREGNEEHPAFVLEADAVHGCADTFFDRGLYGIVNIPPELHNVWVGVTPFCHEVGQFFL